MTGDAVAVVAAPQRWSRRVAAPAAQTQPIFVNGLRRRSSRPSTSRPSGSGSGCGSRRSSTPTATASATACTSTSRGRPRPTAEGLKVPVIYETSPYYAGTASTNTQYFWNDQSGGRRDAAGAPSRRRRSPGTRTGPRSRPVEVSTWVPRGFAVVHSESPGTGLSTGLPDGRRHRTRTTRPKAVIDWLNGRAQGFTTIDGNAEVIAYWSTGKVGMTGTSYNGTLPIAAATTGVAGPRGDHPDRAEHVLLPLLPLERAGPGPRRLARRGHRLPLRLHQQRRPGAAAVLHRHGAARA